MSGFLDALQSWSLLVGALLGVPVAALTVLVLVKQLRQKQPRILRVIEGDEDSDDPLVDQTIWETRSASNPVAPAPVERGGIPIITIANMKGGVGKTTICSNLAAYFQEKEKRVLVIDFDYQGSLSQTMLAQAGISDLRMIAHRLIDGTWNGAKLISRSEHLRPDLSSVNIACAHYAFATAENNLMVDWVQNGEPDIRFNLSRLLTDRDIQKHFDIVLIDAPPRLSTGTICALCASTHLLIPTCLDEMSSEATGYFMLQLSRLRSMLFRDLKLIGIVPSMTETDTGFKDHEKRALKRLADKLTAPPLPNDWVGPEKFLNAASLPQRVAIRKAAGVGVAYLRDKEAKRIFDRLGDAIEPRLG